MLLTVIACIMAFLQVIPTKGQDIPSVIKNVYSLIDDGKYSDGYKLIRDIDNQEVEVYGDSMVMVLNYEKGACLFFSTNTRKLSLFLMMHYFVWRSCLTKIAIILNLFIV